MTASTDDEETRAAYAVTVTRKRKDVSVLFRLTDSLSGFSVSNPSGRFFGLRL